MLVNRVWAMPNSNTFSIKPIGELVERYTSGEKVIIDPFANNCKIGTITNDLNPKFDTTYHMDALDFLKQMETEIADVVLYDPPYCYDNTTEILTENGFKNISEITYSDKIATLNTSSNLLEYQYPTDIVSRDYSGDMILIDSQSINMFVTPNHRCYIKNAFNGKFFWESADSLFNTRNCCWFKKSCDWDGVNNEYFILPSVKLLKSNRKGENIKPDKPIPMKIWLKFLGLYLSEGCCKQRKDKVGYLIHIAQKKEFGRQYIKTVLDELDFNYYIDKNGFTIDDKQLFSYLQQFGKSREKFIPADIKCLSAKYLQCLVEGLMIGDGTNIVYPKFNKSANKMYSYRTFAYYTGSPRLRDDFCEISIKCGYAVSVATFKKKNYDDMYGVHILKAKDFRVYKKDYKKVHNWSGKIYCVTVPNSTLCVKREGRIYWCGNSLRQVKECYEGVGITVTAEHTKASWRARHLDEIARIVKTGGYCLSFGWNTNGVGKKRGFEIVEILIVAHGGSKNDTLCTVERKVAK